MPVALASHHGIATRRSKRDRRTTLSQRLCKHPLDAGLPAGYVR
jgi:hypothetical protein